jgi:hypothetical protein
MRHAVRSAGAILGTVLALAACGKSPSTGPSSGESPSRIVLLPKGNATYNSYDLAYQACTGRTAAEVAKQVGTTATDPAAVAAAFAANSFDRKGRASATKGCLDALEGNAESPPPSPTPTPTG